MNRVDTSSNSSRSSAGPRSVVSPVLGVLLDIVVILVFATLGRRNHDEGMTLWGVLTTASPFLAGAAVGWILVRLMRGYYPTMLSGGITVWFSTLVFGMVLRQVFGAGVALTFVLVAASVLAVGLLGWRAIGMRRT